MTETRETKLRGRFEEFNESEDGSGWDLRRYDKTDLAGEYRDERAQAAWEAWQAAETTYRAEGREDALEEVMQKVNSTSMIGASRREIADELSSLSSKKDLA